MSSRPRHQQIEAGLPFEEVLHEVLGPNGSSLAFVSVAFDMLTLCECPFRVERGWLLVTRRTAGIGALQPMGYDAAYG
jgi:hypothetical protein